MNGILAVDKPEGFTSFDVIAKLRGIARTRKIGHSGTLDPMATGVLPVFFGRAAKACGLLTDEDKSYRATFQLGIETDTQDRTGTVVSQKPVAVGEREVRETLPAFTGEIFQVPPMYSAVKVGGKKLYELARKGLEVERKPRKVAVHSIELVSSDAARHCYTVDVSCPKGTYIRTLCSDLGAQLGCGASLIALRRTKACGFTQRECMTLEQITKLAGAGRLADVLLPVDRVFLPHPPLALSEDRARKFCNGVKIDNALGPDGACGTVRVYWEGLFLGLGEVDAGTGLLSVKKLFHLEGIG